MRRSTILAVSATILLFAITITAYALIPERLAGNLQRIIAVPLLIGIVWYFATWYKRKKSTSLTQSVKRSYLTLILGLFVSGLSVGSLLLVPLMWPSIGATGTRIWLICLIVGVFLGITLLTQWFISRQ